MLVSTNNIKPYFEDVPSRGEVNSSFHVFSVYRESRSIYDAWHYHPEYEICLTLRSKGKRYVGNNVTLYQPDDLVIFGSNLPHGFVCEEKTRQIVIQFRVDFLGENFFHKKEAKSILNLLEKSKSGIEFFGNNKKEATKKILSIYEESDPMTKLVLFLDLLNLLSKNLVQRNICPNDCISFLDPYQIAKIAKMYRYIMDNYKNNITVSEIADHLNMTESNFYKYIKRNTKKSFTVIVNEIRVSYALSLLADYKYSIAQIGFYSGFKNPSYFNKKFKEIMNMTPMEYRNTQQHINLS